MIVSTDSFFAAGRGAKVSFVFAKLLSLFHAAQQGAQMHASSGAQTRQSWVGPCTNGWRFSQRLVSYSVADWLVLWNVLTSNSKFELFWELRPYHRPFFRMSDSRLFKRSYLKKRFDVLGFRKNNFLKNTQFRKTCCNKKDFAHIDFNKKGTCWGKSKKRSSSLPIFD